MSRLPVDLWLYQNYENSRFLPDRVFYEAEETARYMGIPRARIYLNAPVEYLEKNNRRKITEKLSGVYR
jgi:hypothetical protein